jgi:hypothetical protein
MKKRTIKRGLIWFGLFGVATVTLNNGTNWAQVYDKCLPRSQSYGMKSQYHGYSMSLYEMMFEPDYIYSVLDTVFHVPPEDFSKLTPDLWKIYLETKGKPPYYWGLRGHIIPNDDKEPKDRWITTALYYAFNNNKPFHDFKEMKGGTYWTKELGTKKDDPYYDADQYLLFKKNFERGEEVDWNYFLGTCPVLPEDDKPYDFNKHSVPYRCTMYNQWNEMEIKYSIPLKNYHRYTEVEGFIKKEVACKL